MAHNNNDPHKQHHHHILPTKVALMVGGALLFLTVVTVWSAGFDLGVMNFPIAMLIASTKAALVCLFFMNLLYDRKENAVIFLTSFLFLAIFLSITITDIYFRGDVYVKAGDLTPASTGKSKFKKAWNATPELVAHGKELYQAQCVACHGAEGKGNGPAAGSLVPPPRNFTAEAGWKNGRKPSQVFKTLKEGIPGSAMGSFASLPADDRWALSHYVVSIGPTKTTDTPEDLAKIGVDPNKESAGGAETEAPTISVDEAMKLMEEK